MNMVLPTLKSEMVVVVPTSINKMMDADVEEWDGCSRADVDQWDDMRVAVEEEWDDAGEVGWIFEGRHDKIATAYRSNCSRLTAFVLLANECPIAEGGES